MNMCKMVMLKENTIITFTVAVDRNIIEGLAMADRYIYLGKTAPRVGDLLPESEIKRRNIALWSTTFNKVVNITKIRKVGMEIKRSVTSHILCIRQ